MYTSLICFNLKILRPMRIRVKEISHYKNHFNVQAFFILYVGVQSFLPQYEKYLAFVFVRFAIVSKALHVRILLLHALQVLIAMQRRQKFIVFCWIWFKTRKSNFWTDEGECNTKQNLCKEVFFDCCLCMTFLQIWIVYLFWKSYLIIQNVPSIIRMQVRS